MTVTTWNSKHRNHPEKPPLLWRRYLYLLLIKSPCVPSHSKSTLKTRKQPIEAPRKFPKAQWVKPDLMVDAAYRARTGQGLLRHPAFKGMAGFGLSELRSEERFSLN